MRLLTVGHGPLDRVALASLLAGAGVERVIDVDAFRAYAGYSRTPGFEAALDDALAHARSASVALMCSESVWWRCHRRLIADVTLLGRGVEVGHVMPDGRITAHVPAAGARPDGVGSLVWDGAGGADDAPGRTKAPTP
ncbi:DUF488 family protein [Georgenia faecalis]|uniref:DUF488 family protein n=1 Tax=Georgenia faecalis TaxID=2483799 RepID=UPI000FD76DF2|nr:DUF488 family protein [Georgenia faecalis]